MKRLTFKEYYEGSGVTLPSIFNQITGFENLFKAYYFDYYLAYLDKNIFATKLEMKANIIIPEYEIKLDNIEALKQDLLTDKITADTGTITYDNGELNTENKVLPYGNVEYVQPSNTSKQASVQNKQTNNLLKTESLNASEKMQMLEKIESKEKLIMIDLLNEFKTLFFLVF